MTRERAPGAEPDAPRTVRDAIQKKKRWLGTITALLALLFVLCFFVSFSVGRYRVALPTVVKVLLSGVFPLEQTWDPDDALVIWTMRMPRILTAALVGACLSVAGLSFQALFKNPMAAPDILGASSGAGFGAALALFLHLSASAVSLSAFCFGLLAVGIAYLASLRMNADPLLVLILSGVIISSLFNAAVSYLKLVADVEETLPAITYWLMGNFSGATFDSLKTVLLPMAAGLVVLLYMRWKLSVMALGDEEAQALGVNTRLCRLVVIVCATLLTTSSVSVSGVIGWVGLVIPHFARMLVGEDQRFLMPSTLFMGAGFMLLVDDLARSISTMDVPVGILTAFVGAPFFMYLMLRRGGKHGR